MVKLDIVAEETFFFVVCTVILDAVYKVFALVFVFYFTYSQVLNFRRSYTIQIILRKE